MIQFLVAALGLASGLFQDPGPDRLITRDGEEIRGEIAGIEADGSLVVKAGKEPRTIHLDNLRRIQFEEKPKIELEKTGDKLFPRFGGSMTGTVVTIDADRVALKCPHGFYSIRRDEVRAVSLGKVATEPKEIKDDQDLLLMAPDLGKPEEPTAVPGKFETLDAERARMGGVDYARLRVREIRFRRGQGRDPAVGLFARVLMKNGDGLIGTLRKVEAGRVHLFTHYSGVASIEKSAIHSIAFVPLARLQFGHILVCDSAGVREIDREGKSVWTYGDAAVGCSSARRLPNGNVLVSNGNRNSVFEVRPTGTAGGTVIWTIDSLATPQDAQRLENGNVLVAEYGGTRIVEVDPTDSSTKKTTQLPGSPTSVERLEDGGTLVSMNYGQVMELDAKGIVRVRYSVTGSNEYRATRTAEGTVLIADQRGAQVVEMDRKNAILWRYETPQPRMAIRLDDGHTMILTRRGQIIEVDSRGQTVQTYGTFSGASSFSVH